MSTKAAEVNAREIFQGLDWKWIPLEAVGFNLLLNFALRFASRLLPLNTPVLLAAVFGLSVLISWKILVRVRDVSSPSVVHGTLLGILANVFYIVWTVLSAPEGSSFAVSLESFLGSTAILFGCIAGGFLASRR